MANFFRLTSIIDDDSITIDLVSHSAYSFTQGVKFKEPFPEPVKFKVNSKPGEIRLPTLFLPEPVFSEEFIHYLRKLGINNMDDYEAQISLKRKKMDKITGYRAVNIIGVVACANLDKSKYEEFEGMYFFDNLVIDKEKVPSNLDFFRLQEAHEFIIISKKLAHLIEQKRFPDILLNPIES